MVDFITLLLVMVNQGVFVPGYKANNKEFPAQFFGRANLEGRGENLKVFAIGEVAVMMAKLPPGQHHKVKVGPRGKRYEICGVK